MKQFHYSLIMLAILALFFIFKSKEPIAEHDVSFLFEKDGCKIYSFRVYDDWKYKKHFFTTCQGEVIDPEDINITEVENEQKK